MAAAAARLLRSALPGPGAASPGEAYSGSRTSAQRFEYSVHSTAGFVELAPSSFRAASWGDRFVAAKEFYNALAKVPGWAQQVRAGQRGRALRGCVCRLGARLCQCRGADL